MAKRAQRPPTARSRRGQPKGDKRARTRARLLEAARQVIREKGYEHTTIEGVAQRAGMTSGAIYGNFKDRNALFVALGQTYWSAITPAVAPEASLREKMRAYAEAAIAAIPERRPVAIGRLTGLAYALSHEDLRVQVEQATSTSYAAGAAWLSAGEDELPMRPEVMVAVIHALTEGLMFQRFLTPDLIPDEVFHQAFRALAASPERARRVERPGVRSSAPRRPRPRSTRTA